jgi:uncharacterized membrane protein
MISLIEFVFWNIITVIFSDDKYQSKLHRYGIEDVMFAVNVVNYVIILVSFLYFIKITALFLLPILHDSS